MLGRKKTPYDIAHTKVIFKHFPIVLRPGRWDEIHSIHSKIQPELCLDTSSMFTGWLLVFPKRYFSETLADDNGLSHMKDHQFNRDVDRVVSRTNESNLNVYGISHEIERRRYKTRPSKLRRRRQHDF